MTSLNDLERHLLIKTMLRLKGTSLSEIAQVNNVTISTISLVSRGRGKSARLENALAAVVGVSRQQLWPDRAEDVKMT